MNESNVRETKDRILDAAEHLIAHQGVEATSLRQITSAAEVNLAAVNYHFSTKDELVKSVYLRRIRPMNERRLQRLTEIESNEAWTLDDLLDAFYEPVLETAEALGKKGLSMGTLLGRLYTEPHDAAQSIIANEMGETVQRFSRAMFQLLPHLSMVEVLWRLNFTVAILAHTLALGVRMQKLSGGRIDPSNSKEVLRQMKVYAKAGLMAPSQELNK